MRLRYQKYALVTGVVTAFGALGWYLKTKVRIMDYDLLEKFRLSGIPPAPRDVAKVNVFETDANGIMNASAEDISTGNKNNITITNNKRELSIEEIEEMLLTAKRYKKKAKAREKVEKYAYDLRNKIKDENIASKLTLAEKKKVEDAVEEAIKWSNENKFVEINESEEKMNQLMTVCDSVSSVNLN